MPNLYVTPQEIKIALPDAIRQTTVKYDDALLRLANDVSRYIDRHTHRRFYPIAEKRTFTARHPRRLTIDALFSITSLKTDLDGDRTYETTWAATDYDLLPFNSRGSYHEIETTPNGTKTFPSLARGVEIDGVWADVDERVDAWESSTDTVKDNPLSAGAATVTVASAEGVNLYGEGPRFLPGQILRIESEFIEVTKVNPGTEVLTVLRGRNGTAAAAHVLNTPIDIWRPVEPVRKAAEIMAVRQFERALQGYADSRADVELGVLRFVKKIDPEAKELLSPYRRIMVAV